MSVSGASGRPLTVGAQSIQVQGPAGSQVEMQVSPFPASVIRAPSTEATCTCTHWAYCDHGCHHRACDPTENACDIGFLPDEGGLTPWGCLDCTPGAGAPHVLGCDLIGWNVPARLSAPA